VLGNINGNVRTIDHPISLIPWMVKYMRPRAAWLDHLGTGDGWSVGLSEMQIVYDWDQTKFTSLPLGVSISKLQKFGGQPIQFNLQYEQISTTRRYPEAMRCARQ